MKKGLVILFLYFWAHFVRPRSQVSRGVCAIDVNEPILNAIVGVVPSALLTNYTKLLEN